MRILSNTGDFPGAAWVYDGNRAETINYIPEFRVIVFPPTWAPFFLFPGRAGPTDVLLHTVTRYIRENNNAGNGGAGGHGMQRHERLRLLRQTPLHVVLLLLLLLNTPVFPHTRLI